MSETKSVSRADYLNGIGAQLFAKGQIEPARLHFLGALSLEPDHAQALQNLGASLRQLGHYAAAAAVAKRSVVVSRGNPFCRSNLGVSQLSLRQFGSALALLHSVLDDLPDSGPSWHNYGLALYMMGRYNEALVAFDKSLDQADANPELRSDRALTLLSIGDIAGGLSAYEVRWNILKQNKIWTLDIPEWKGEELIARRILVHHEQGFGDSIMLVRFVPRLEALGAKVTLAVPVDLLRLFRHSFPSVSVIDINGPELESEAHFDYHTPMLSMMRHLGIKWPSDVTFEPYLHADPTAAPAVAKLPPGYRIGLCWASGDHSPALRERRRLAPIVSFLPLLEWPSVALVSLQKGREVGDLIANGLEGLVFDTAPWLDNFAATAAIIDELDLVISVDSAVAHLAGALGKPTIMLSPYTRCWRWWSKSSGWPWYAEMQIEMQSENGSWDAAIRAAITSALDGVASRKKHLA